MALTSEAVGECAVPGNPGMSQKLGYVTPPGVVSQTEVWQGLQGRQSASTQAEGCWRPAPAAQGFGLVKARCPGQGSLYIQSPTPHIVTSDANVWVPG